MAPGPACRRARHPLTIAVLHGCWARSPCSWPSSASVQRAGSATSSSTATRASAYMRGDFSVNRENTLLAKYIARRRAARVRARARGRARAGRGGRPAHGRRAAAARPPDRGPVGGRDRLRALVPPAPARDRRRLRRRPHPDRALLPARGLHGALRRAGAATRRGAGPRTGAGAGRVAAGVLVGLAAALQGARASSSCPP